MPYTVETTLHRPSGRPAEWQVVLTETAAEVGSEWEIGGAGESQGDPCPFEVARLALYRAELVSGTATTLDPSLGKASGWSSTSLDHIWANDDAGPFLEAEPRKLIRFRSTGQSIYGKSGADAGADNLVRTEMIFVEGAGGAPEAAADVLLTPRHPNFGAATVYDSAGLLVGSASTVGPVTSFVIDATQAGRLFLAAPLQGPAGVVYTGGADWTVPTLKMKLLTAPPPTSRVSVQFGLKDGPGVPVELPGTATVPPASGEQWYALGFSHVVAGGPYARSEAHNIAAADNTPAVAGGIFATSEGSFTPDITGVGAAGFGRHFRGIIQALIDSGLGTAQQIDIVATYKYAPWVLLVISSDGTSGNSAMPISLEASYKAQPA